ncbi:isopentenyl diphosphate isomerase [Secundilactobacillus oryzae JCM 18671]|uniref:Isopentenyl-diphosphate delta-isomerase n=1 Tax=Secundilactobacillus oryzae JCM 18671 TaxID=1291743 RepID=A0A081BIL8_9LACO|nr:type 2 isopentenyl-diphosphate Delta-isomerase [Secundilactobacillus oryzae]GAK47886.1 isopentenyl diphosphate isomerase [Secundilactobacillus oryzae JCM 18671]
MTSIQSHRKDEHVSLAEKFHDVTQPSDFDQVRFVNNALPEIDLADIDLSTTIAGHSVPFPLFIEAMTGGSERTGKLNQQLATIAKDLNLVMATGSQSVALKDASLATTFSIARETNPNGLLFGNVGAGTPPEAAKTAVEMISADALQIHLNPAQELIMPEGDRKFNGWLANIRHIHQAVDVPVVIKEVGFGLNQEVIGILIQNGIHDFDLGGRGGTNFAQIENFRRSDKALDYLQNWGISTVEALLESKPYQDQANFSASGGIRNPLDVIKALALGASSVGIAGVVLHTLITTGVEQTESMLTQWLKDLKRIMVLLGAKSITDLHQIQPIFSLELMNYMNQRHLTK